jgi:hypothetical protein
VTEHPSSADDAASQARDVLHRTTEQASEQVQRVRGSVQGRVGVEVDRRSTAAGEQVGAASQAMRDMSGQLRSQGNELPARLAEEIGVAAARFLKASSERRYTRRGDGTHPAAAHHAMPPRGDLEPGTLAAAARTAE